MNNERDKIKQNASPNNQNILVPKQTVLSLFEAVFASIGQDHYRKIVYLIGEKVGLTEGRILRTCLPNQTNQMDTEDYYIRQVMELVCSESVLGKCGKPAWSKLSNNTIQISLDNNLFTQNRKGDIHRHCLFIAGYLFGSAWILFGDIARKEVKEFSGDRQLIPLRPREVKENPALDICVFEMQINHEELRQAFDRISLSEESFIRGMLTEAVLYARAALELGFKQKVSISGDSRVSFFSLLDAYRRANVPKILLNYAQIGKIYERASVAVHGARTDYPKEMVEEIILEVEEILRVLELSVIGRRYRQNICLQVGETFSRTGEEMYKHE